MPKQAASAFLLALVQAIPKKYASLVIAMAYTGIVTWMLCVPGKSLPDGPNIPHADKYVHLLLFGLLCLLWLPVWQKIKATRPVWVLMLLLSGYGLLLEWVQLRFAEGRSFSWLDWVADTAGVLLGWLFYRWLHKRAAFKAI